MVAYVCLRLFNVWPNSGIEYLYSINGWHAPFRTCKLQSNCEELKWG